MTVHPDKTAHRAVEALGGTYTVEQYKSGYAYGHAMALEEAETAVSKPDALMAELLAALICARSNLDHMAAWIGAKNAGYSFECLGEDMPGINEAIAKATGDA